MPITLTLTEGVLPDAAIPQAVEQITNAFLRHHALSGNRVMTPNVTAHVNLLPRGLSFAGGKPVEGAWIETKTPSFALADHDVQSGFFSEATEIVHALSGGTLPRQRIWTNGVHAVDGTWAIDGITMTNAEIGAAVSAA
jgi:hypothetical protein